MTDLPSDRGRLATQVAVLEERMKAIQAEYETGQERLQRVVADLRADLARRDAEAARRDAEAARRAKADFRSNVLLVGIAVAFGGLVAGLAGHLIDLLSRLPG